MGKRIGILGGAFDPVHKGHIHMAISACDELGLDEVWLMPVGHSPNKDENNMAPFQHRYNMCQIAAEPDPRLFASDFEVSSMSAWEGHNYTYRTLEKLDEVFHGNEFYFIMGGDSLDYFDTWVKPERIAELAKIAVVPRDQFDVPNLERKRDELGQLFPCSIEILHCAMNPLSSTEVRESLRVGKPLEDAFPPGVLEYIRGHELYRYGLNINS
ncbi:MAG: nicotinate (nicotinamide) nucleotide adenylyltransferase [Clostridiales bacterium]|nr:nicotinate (nicotinamide) nucleotide adenylyltransferase [Clostridiales bacterium]